MRDAREEGRKGLCACRLELSMHASLPGDVET